MDDILDLVSEHCANELNAYSDCVGQNPSDWGSKCKELETKLTVCSEKFVKDLQTVKTKCSTAILDYEGCIFMNQSNPESCIDQLKKLYDCTNSVFGD
ncbi:Coiled-coil-helix-coiled-coil-helix domain-containing protein 5 [Zancudomyces culisetae]|uniref:Coiled-coil-helix-coiled-coil-helix domain-containing protein 5 n=1 Tax=Zancudomyces culisetae TaxID=1213189 RepID=A0A1R1PSF9_ZANCU|nr:Coiled-coil-helix-coiled-coil-helix domain-containing protein 5 [Zancudomyces culisetae]|eukprot:OMH83898.1 Coiled-coil-helix-coiled-coil-helix domain-containing protein 5 [Zancudomyces culisetae]